MPKPKNDGQLLSVRVSLATHAAIHRVLAIWAGDAKTPWGPGGQTKAKVIEMAIAQYLECVEGKAVHVGPGTHQVPDPVH